MAKDTTIVVRLRDRFSRGMKSMGRGVRSLRRRFLNLKSAVGAAVVAFGAFAAGRAVFRGLKAAVNIAKDFGEQMAVVRAVTGASAEEFKLLEDAAKQAGTTTRFTATEAASGLEDLARNGFTARQSVTALNDVLNFAQANAIDVANASIITTDAIKQFGLEAKESSRVVDVFTKTAQSTATTVEQMGNAMSYAAPLARQAGVSIEETSSIIGQLADQGFRGQRAGVALRTSFALLSDNSSKFSRALGEAGIKTRDFTEIIDILASDTEKAQEIMLSLPLRVRPAIAALVQSGGGNIEKLTKILRESGGAANEAARVMDDTLGGAFKNLKSAIEGAGLELVEELVEELQTEVLNLADAIRSFIKSDAFARLKTDLAEAFRNGAEAVKEFLREFDFQEATRKTADFVKTVGGSVKSVINLFRRFGQGVSLVSNGARIIGNGVQVIVQKIAQVTAAAVQAILRAQNQMPAFFRGFKDFSEEINYLQAVIDQASKQAEQNYRELGEATFNFKKALDALRSPIDSVEEGLENVGEAGGSAKKGTEEAAEGIDKVGESAKETTPDLLALHEELDNVLNKAKETADAQDEVSDALRRQNPTLEETGKSYSTISSQLDTWKEVIKIWKGETKDVGDETEKTKDKTKQLADETDKAAESTTRFSSAQDDAASSSSGLAQGLAGVITGFRNISEGMAEASDNFIRSQAGVVQTVSHFFGRLADFQDRTMRQYEEQKRQVQRLTQEIEQGVSAQRALQLATRDVRGQFHLLNESDLSALEAALDRARSKAESFRREIDSAVQSVEEDLARARGNEEELLQRKFDQRRKELEMALQTAIDPERKKNVREALKSLDELEEIELRKLREREKREREGNEETNKQRRENSRDYHGGEMDRIEERNRSSSGSVNWFKQQEEEARRFHANEMTRIEERKEAEKQAAEEAKRVNEELTGGAGGATKGARKQGSETLEVVHRVLSDQLNGNRISLDPTQVEDIAGRVLQRISQMRGTAGLYRGQ